VQGSDQRLCWSASVSATPEVPLSTVWFGRLLDLVLTKIVGTNNVELVLISPTSVSLGASSSLPERQKP